MLAKMPGKDEQRKAKVSGNDSSRERKRRDLACGDAEEGRRS